MAHQHQQNADEQYHKMAALRLGQDEAARNLSQLRDQQLLGFGSVLSYARTLKDLPAMQIDIVEGILAGIVPRLLEANARIDQQTGRMRDVEQEARKTSFRASVTCV